MNRRIKVCRGCEHFSTKVIVWKGKPQLSHRCSLDILPIFQPTIEMEYNNLEVPEYCNMKLEHMVMSQ